MKLGTLVIKKIITYSITYFVFTLILINIFGRGSQFIQVSPSFQFSVDLSCAIQEYGQGLFMLSFIDRIVQHASVFAAFNVYLIATLILMYLLHVTLLIALNYMDVQPHDWKICFSKALSSIAIGMSSFIYFLTSIFVILFFYSALKLHCLTDLIASFTALFILYSILSFIVFAINEYCIYLFEKIKYKQKIVGMKVNKRWYEFWKPDHY